MLSRNTILIVALLMSLSLLGIIGIQVYWIIFQVELNEKTLDNNVLSAMRSVAEAVEKKEEDCAKQDQALITKTYDRLVEQTLYTASAKRAIDEKINLQHLDNILRQQLLEHNINLDYNYGVFDQNFDYYAIVDNQYQVKPNTKNLVHTGIFKKLDVSKYQVKLFERHADYGTMGELRVYFPNKFKLIWSNVWKSAIASGIFTAIILFCFVYTLVVIVRQKKLSEMKNDFINNMTHEFKTPIATISLATDSIKSPTIIENKDKINRFLNIIKQENKRMLSQVEKVLQMALIEKQDFKLNLEKLSLHDIILQAVEYANLQAEQKGGVVCVDLGANDDTIEGDQTHISNIIHNLLDNANKYSPEKPNITVSTAQTYQGVKVSIKDEGIGMTKEQKKHIFEKFYRAHTGNLHDVKGFGLGLSYVKTMVLAHRGDIQVISELGKGSTFIITFPHKILDKNNV